MGPTTRAKTTPASTPGSFSAHAGSRSRVTPSDTGAVDGETSCATCGTPTKRRSGLCRRHDPAHTKAAEHAAPKSGNNKTNSGPALDTEATPVPADELRQCEYNYVPDHRAHGDTGGYRQCKNAVRNPATVCHEHGGDPTLSLGRTFAKASAEAGRNACYPLHPDHWNNSSARLEAAYGDLLAMLDTDTTAFAAAVAALRAQQAIDGSGRFSAGNQMLLLAQYANHAMHADGLDSEAAVEKAMGLLAEPTMTAKAWAEHGRHATERGAVVVYFFRAKVERRDNETDDEFEKRVKAGRMHGSSHFEYPLSHTDGEPYEQPDSPLDERIVAGHGEPAVAKSRLMAVAERWGIPLEVVSTRPAGGSYGYWDGRKAVVWDRGGQDEWAVLHTAAHELGHAKLGHLSDQSAETSRADCEAAAESFAHLVSAHFGADSTETSAGYIRDWQKAHGVDMRAGGYKAMRSAVAAFDQFLTELD